MIGPVPEFCGGCSYRFSCPIKRVIIHDDFLKDWDGEKMYNVMIEASPSCDLKKCICTMISNKTPKIKTRRGKRIMKTNVTYTKKFVSAYRYHHRGRL